MTHKTRWDYRIETTMVRTPGIPPSGRSPQHEADGDPKAVLNEAGADGWELISVVAEEVIEDAPYQARPVKYGTRFHHYLRRPQE